MTHARQHSWRLVCGICSTMLVTACGAAVSTGSIQPSNDSRHALGLSEELSTSAPAHAVTKRGESDVPIQTPVPSAPAYTTAHFVQEVRQHGATVEIAHDRIDHGLTILSQRLEVNDENVYVYEYPDAVAAQADVQTVSPDGSTITRTTAAGTEVRHGEWIAPSHWYYKDRLIVIYAGTNARLLQMLETSLGLPFAGVTTLPSAPTRTALPTHNAP